MGAASIHPPPLFFPLFFARIIFFPPAVVFIYHHVFCALGACVLVHKSKLFRSLFFYFFCSFLYPSPGHSATYCDVCSTPASQQNTHLPTAHNVYVLHTLRIFIYKYPIEQVTAGQISRVDSTGAARERTHKKRTVVMAFAGSHKEGFFASRFLRWVWCA